MAARDKASARRVFLRDLVPRTATFAFAGSFTLRPLLALYVVRFDPEVFLSSWIVVSLAFFFWLEYVFWADLRKKPSTVRSAWSDRKSGVGDVSSGKMVMSGTMFMVRGWQTASTSTVVWDRPATVTGP